MSRWFRMYDEVLDDPKVQRLSGDDFKAWVNMLCLASRRDGSLPPVQDIAFALRIDTRKATAIIGRMVEAGLLDAAGDRYTPHGWSARQYKSDVSTVRVKQHRERKKAVTGNADETFHGTPPDTDTDTDSSVTKVTGAEAPLVDPEKVMFDSGLALLTSSGVKPQNARALLGKWKRDQGPEIVISALGRAKREGAMEPVAFIEGCFRAKAREAAWESPC